MSGIKFSSLAELRKIEVSFLESKETNEVIEQELNNFFTSLKDVPALRFVRISLPQLTKKTFVTLVVENNTRKNIIDVFEF